LENKVKSQSKFDWWLTGICLAKMFNGLVYMTFAATLPILQQEWKMSAAAAGSIVGGFQFGYAISLIVFSFLADRFCPKKLYLGSMTAGAICSLLFAAWARDYYSGLVLYTLTALSMGGNYTTGLIIMAQRYPMQTRGRAMGFFIASTSLGDSPILSAALTETVNSAYMGGAFGLRSMLGFSAGAISPIILGIVLDLTNPGVSANGLYTNWGWAFSVLGLGGMVAWLASIYYGRLQKKIA
jgi:MFS family permease